MRTPRLFAFGNLGFFYSNGVRLFLSESDAQTNESIPYFHVEDIHVAHDGLKNRGVEFINAPHLVLRHEDGREEWMAFFNDNEGRALALISQTNVGQGTQTANHNRGTPSSQV